MQYLLEKLDFGNEAGDDIQPEEITSFFVEQPAFRDFLNPSKSLLLATARKGVGKSALLKWVEARIPEEVDSEALVISVKGSDLVRSAFKLASPLSLPNEYIRDWMVRLCALINREIGRHLTFAGSDDSITMVEAAEIDGFKSRNILTALTERLRKILPRLEATKATPPNEIELLKRYEGRSVWILVDDLDATYQRTPQENLELATFFSACRYLVSNISGLSIRITMRTDVWSLLRRFDESLDKFEQYVHDISWSQADFRSLLYKRIAAQLQVLGMQLAKPHERFSQIEIEEHLIDMVFEKRVQWADSERRTYMVLYTLSYHRPRWAIQLCKLAQKEARAEHSELIAKKHIDAVWGAYGQKRIADLVSEHKHQCAEIEEIIVGFRGAERRMTRPQLLEWITNRIVNHMSPVIEGKINRSPLEIAHFLYRLGFIVARAADPSGHFEHYHFSEMPDFLSTRTNQDFGAIWEIHPCYREALDITKLNLEQRRKLRLGS